ncbi:MAG: 2-oxoacid:acceptor oxidoreductase family protein [Candidatus Sericytochromatia bacterium]|nr:2-oxoacid:acceptor oxidoreductase family protein [Candidatus Sericytochromatia bacterium]
MSQMPFHTIAAIGQTGDGIQFLGRILAEAAAEAGLHPTLFPEPGVAMYGDRSAFRLVIGDHPALMAGQPDWLLVSRPGPYTWEVPNRLADSDRSGQQDGWILPAVQLATEAGFAKGALIVMLGSLSTRLEWLTEGVLIRTLKERLHDQPRQVSLNMACFRAGRSSQSR